MSAPSHSLVNGELTRDEHGIAARCTCGWASGGHFSSAGASAAFENHLEPKATTPTLDELLANMTDENRHPET